MQLALYDLPDDYFERFVPTIEAVTADDVSLAMSRHLDPPRLVTVVVGDHDAIRSDLRGVSDGEPVVLAPDSF
jgi:predicted Zn-dependent peptidase